MSSEEAEFGLLLAEKFFGLILLIVGALAIYFTFTSTTVLGIFSSLFGFLGFVILLSGLFLIIAKVE